MLIKPALLWAKQKLKKSESAQLDAEVLLSFIIHKPKEFIYAHPETKLNWMQKIRFFYLIFKRAKNWPVAALTKVKEFYGRAFYVNKHVLIPRPLTEELIDKAIEYNQDQKTKNKACPERSRGEQINIVDIGTGSGNIIITLIKELQKEKYDLNKFKFYATDISQAALKVAKKNARWHQVDNFITFLKGDLLKPLKDKKSDLILANLPYLNQDDLNEPSIKKEPKLALLGNYNEFFKQIGTIHELPLPHSQPTVIYEDKTGIHCYSTSCQV